MARLLFFILMTVFAGQLTLAADSVADLPAYDKNETVSGRLRSVGSDSMDELMKAWEKAFKEHHPKLRIFHQGKGSDTAIPLLLERRVEFGPMSRSFSDEEIVVFEERLGKTPLQIPVAIDAIAIYVHPDNPVAQSGLTTEQLRAVFGAGGAAKTWGDLGVNGALADQPIQRYSRNVVSGTRAVFQDKVLNGGEFGEIESMPSSKLVVAGVAIDPAGIGYSSLSYRTGDVAVAPVAAGGGAPIPPIKGDGVDDAYPLKRELYLMVNLDPNDRTADLKREFLRFVLSQDGQRIALEEGLFPVGATTAQKNLEAVISLSSL